MPLPALIFDIACLVVLLLSALYFARKGIIAGLLSLLGTAIAIAVSTFAARSFALPVFDKFFRAGLLESLESAFADQNALAIENAMQQLNQILPAQAREALLGAVNISELNPAQLADKMVTEIVQPLVLPVVTLVLFVVCFLLARVLIGVLLHLLSAARGLPYIGTVQKAFGAVAGVCIGALYVFVLVMVLEVAGNFLGAEALGGGVLTSSYFYKAFSQINFIL